MFADEVGGSLPEPWSRTVRAAARSRADEAQAALGAAVAHGLPPRDKVTGWWRLIALAQWLLMLLTLAGVVWIVLILSLHGSHKSSSLISDISLVPWLAVMVVALLLLGWLIESWCQNMVVLAADREREQANQAIMAADRRRHQRPGPGSRWPRARRLRALPRRAGHRRRPRHLTAVRISPARSLSFAERAVVHAPGPVTASGGHETTFVSRLPSTPRSRR